MAERPINWPLEIKRLEVEIARDQVNLQQNDLKLMELEDEIRKIGEASTGIHAAVTAKHQKLDVMKKEHGGE